MAYMENGFENEPPRATVSMVQIWGRGFVRAACRCPSSSGETTLVVIFFVADTQNDCAARTDVRFTGEEEAYRADFGVGLWKDR